MTSWPLQDAKNRFSELVNRALERGPQVVTKHGEDCVVVVSLKEYRKWQRPKKSLTDFLLKSPLAGIEPPEID